MKFKVFILLGFLFAVALVSSIDAAAETSKHENTVEDRVAPKETKPSQVKDSKPVEIGRCGCCCRHNLWGCGLHCCDGRGPGTGCNRPPRTTDIGIGIPGVGGVIPGVGGGIPGIGGGIPGVGEAFPGLEAAFPVLEEAFPVLVAAFRVLAAVQALDVMFRGLVEEEQAALPALLALPVVEELEVAAGSVVEETDRSPTAAL